MADVFVSYKSEDRERVRPLVDALSAEGFSVWWDDRIGAGESWREAIEAELHAARVVVVVWSAASTGPGGRFVRDEAAHAQRRGAYLPVMIDAVELPLGFGETQAISLVGWNGEARDRRFALVTAAVRNGPDVRAAPWFPAERAPRPDRRRIALGAGAGVLLLAGAAGGVALLAPRRAKAATGLAVLPFANLSGDPAQAWFSDGLAEELRSVLARVAALPIVGRTSCEKVRDLAVPEAAAKLNVAHVLTGSVRRSPDAVRVAAQLVDGRTGLERWSQTFDRQAGDALALQADIALQVADALRARLVEGDRAALARSGTRSQAAYDLYLQAGETVRASFEEADLSAALALYDAAIREDPAYAEAHAARARMLLSLSNHAETRAVAARRIALAAEAAERATALDARSGEAASALGLTRVYRLEPRAALAAYDRARAAAPGDARVLDRRARLLIYAGRGSEALPTVRQLEARDPLDPRRAFLTGLNCGLARRYDEALAAYDRAEALGLQDGALALQRAEALIQAGRDEEGLR